MGVISQHQISTFSSPVNGTTPVDANTVRGNDNTVKTAYNAHDADTTIHLQNGLVASRPAASTAGQMWLATDTGAVYAYLDTGSAWVEVNYFRNTGGTVTGNVVVTGTLGVTGVATFTAAPVFSSGTASQTMELDGSKALVTVAITGTGNYVKSASPTLTGTVALAALAASGNISSAALLLSGTAVVAGASAGEIVLANTFALRGVNAAGSASSKLIWLTNANRVALGTNDMTLPVLLPVDAAANFPAGNANLGGAVGVDSTNNRLVYYSGTNRYYLTGTSF